MIDEPTQRLDEGALRAQVPRVLAGLARRGEDFDAAEDALQEALLEALRARPATPPRDPQAWLATLALRHGTKTRPIRGRGALISDVFTEDAANSDPA
jgi:predicted RNA polymerase sigma factor